jgi:hypothetical protein
MQYDQIKSQTMQPCRCIRKFVFGGGRCNVTHACFEPNELVKYYPRGEKECADLSINFLLVTPSNGLKTWRRTKTETTDGCFLFLIPPKLLSNVFLTLLKTRNRSLDSVQSLFKKRQYGK